MNFPRAARLAGALGAAAVVLVVLSGRDAALAAPGGGSCPPLPAPLDWSEVTELAEYEGPIVAVSERAIMEAAAGAPNADEIFLDVTGCPICTVVMHHNLVRLACPCGRVMHEECFNKLWDYAAPDTAPPCPFCRQPLQRGEHARPELLLKALKLFEEKGWIPPAPRTGRYDLPDDFADPFHLPKTLGKYIIERIAAQLDLSLFTMFEAAALISGDDPDEQYAALLKTCVMQITTTAADSPPAAAYRKKSPDNFSRRAVADWIQDFAQTTHAGHMEILVATEPQSLDHWGVEWGDRLLRLSHLVGVVTAVTDGFAERLRIDGLAAEPTPFVMRTAYAEHCEKLDGFLYDALDIKGMWNAVTAIKNIYDWGVISPPYRSPSSRRISVRVTVEEFRIIEFQSKLGN